MRNKRFLLSLALLVLSLVAVDWGINAALDRAARASSQSSFAVYDEQGRTLLAYNGDLSALDHSVKPESGFAVPRFLHRT